MASDPSKVTFNSTVREFKASLGLSEISAYDKDTWLYFLVGLHCLLYPCSNMLISCNASVSLNALTRSLKRATLTGVLLIPFSGRKPKKLYSKLAQPRGCSLSTTLGIYCNGDFLSSIGRERKSQNQVCQYKAGLHTNIDLSKATRALNAEEHSTRSFDLVRDV